MKYFYLFFFVLVLICNPSSSFAQIFYSNDCSVSISAPNYWYRTHIENPPNVEEVISILGNPNNGIMIRRETSSLLTENSLADFSDEAIAIFQDSQIQEFLKLYPNGYVQFVKRGHFDNIPSLMIYYRVPMANESLGLFVTYILKKQQLYTIVLSCLGSGPIARDAASTFKTIKFLE